MAATCDWCQQPMDGRACTLGTAVVEGVSYHRVPYEPAHPAAHCHDCATPDDGLHHPGCDMERCPRCAGQAISCGCRWAGDEPDPEDDGYRETESPYARRVE